ncbi:MAG: hypothetical protein CUN49_04365 [Candidatus Thermofonsia Clade 1 bacterium]|uniref:non-specific serine/threonine protein kinase n=1 Tax=Candidatus Thermofonsia Clade 1 bacterium TaxID=2364210 RepID=A0A2M8PGG5_9CHLR|nr:MAG: hypothetical protein CUN49_04365 [Candidatus Thermofonsia Clade 1 bacterium]RMF54203.1 MAG: serine/threonine protein kinase [Chloroflexota bacterium]
MESLIGQQLGQYQITAKLGAGGMATVYRARQTSIERDVAIKVIRTDLMEDENFVARFRNEARVIASLQHLHIVKVFDYGNQGNIVYLVMELLEGGSLSRFLRQNGALPLKLATQMLNQISDALDYAHSRGIIHRDLKPDNVLLDHQQNAFLTDFGIAKILGDTSSRTRTGMVMGTPPYMAPELWRGEVAEVRTDIYALGILLYEMLTGTIPFRADTPYQMMHQHIYEAPPSLSAQGIDLPIGVDHVLAKALAKNPEQRFASAGQLAEAFREALSGQDFSRFAPQPPQADKPQPTPKRTPVRTASELLAPTMPPTLPEFSTPSSGRLPTEPHLQRSKRRANILALLVSLLVVAIVGLGALAALSANQATLEQTVTAEAIAGLPTDTPQSPMIIVVPTSSQAPPDPSATPSQTPSDVPSSTPSATLTHTPSSTSSATATHTLSSTPSATATHTPSSTPSATHTHTSTATFTYTPSNTPSATFTYTPSATATPTLDLATIVAATLAPIQSATALARQVQQTVDAIQAATVQAELFRAELTRVAQQLTAVRANAQQTLSAQQTLDALLRPINTPTHTLTPIPMSLELTPTPITCPGFLPSRLVIGQYGRITPGDPNRLREVPFGPVLTQIYAGETFRVLDGPICGTTPSGEGLAWWKVEFINPRNGRTYIGWTAEGSGGAYWIEPLNAP